MSADSGKGRNIWEETDRGWGLHRRRGHRAPQSRTKGVSAPARAAAVTELAPSWSATPVVALAAGGGGGGGEGASARAVEGAARERPARAAPRRGDDGNPPHAGTTRRVRSERATGATRRLDR